MAESLCAVCDHCKKHHESGIDVRMRGMPPYYPPGWVVVVGPPACEAWLFCSLDCAIAHDMAIKERES